MSIKPDFSQRKARPQSLAGVFGAVLRTMGVQPGDADMGARWREIMGDEIADICDFVKTTKAGRDKCGTLIVHAKTPACALPLSYRTNEIIDIINGYFGRSAVAKIVVRK